MSDTDIKIIMYDISMLKLFFAYGYIKINIPGGVVAPCKSSACHTMNELMNNAVQHCLFGSQMSHGNQSN